MKKMVSLFKRDFKNKECPAYDEYEPEAIESISSGYIATQKFDGTACLIKDGGFYKRYRKKKENDVPFLHWSFDPEQKTGHGWTPVTDDANDQYLREAHWIGLLDDGTYECCGPMIQQNPENLGRHMLLRHGSVKFGDVPIEYNALKEWLRNKDIEGVVFHCNDGNMIKIKKSDFGMTRKP